MMRFLRTYIFQVLIAACFVGWAPLALANPPITALAFSPDGHQLLVGSQAGVEVRRWPDLKLQRKLDSLLTNVHDICVTRDRLAVVGGDPSEFGSVEVYSWPQGERLSKLTRHTDVIYGATWNEDGSQLATAAGDAAVIVGDPVDPSSARTLQGHSRGVLAVAYVPNSPLLVSCGLDNSLRVWNLESGQVERILDNHRGAVRDLAICPIANGLPMVASASADRTVRFWQPTIGRLVRYARLSAEPLTIAWTGDGAHVVAGCIDGHVRVIRADDVTVMADLPALDGWAYEVAVAPSEKEIVVAGGNADVKRILVP